MVRSIVGVIPYVVAFLIGVFANWGFAMLARIFNSSWNRYKVSFLTIEPSTDEVDRDTGEAVINYLLGVRVSPYVGRDLLRRALMPMPPLSEDLYSDVALDGGSPSQALWVEGDVSTRSLFANGGKKGYLCILTFITVGKVYLAADFTNTGTLIGDGAHSLVVRVTRATDDAVAAKCLVTFQVTGGDLVGAPALQGAAE